MKKGVVVILVLLAAIVLVSPAIVGRLAEKSMDENLNWAATEAGDLTVTSEHFDRGWFSSEGRHRVELGEGRLVGTLRAMGGNVNPDELPVLIINTRIDHGLIPLGSIGSEGGSLSPGLGNAESTVQVEMPDGQLVDLPGMIYSKISLGGELRSSYQLEPGARQVDDANIAWGKTEINVDTNPVSGKVVFDGNIGSFSVGDGGKGVSLDGLSFDGHQQPTKYGIAVGDVAVSLGRFSTDDGAGGGVGEMSFDATTNIDDGKVGGDASLKMAMTGVPQFGDVSFDMAMTLDGADAAAMGRLQVLADAADANADPMALYATMESDLKQLFAAGFEFSFDKLDVTLPMGTITSVVAFSFAEEDPATFEWTSLLLSTEASVDLSIPAELVETFAQGSPEAAMVIGGGYLVKRGDVYVTKAQLKKGLLTVNGAPIPIPLGQF